MKHGGPRVSKPPFLLRQVPMCAASVSAPVFRNSSARPQGHIPGLVDHFRALPFFNFIRLPMPTLSTRTTVPIRSTYSRPTVLLDFAADLATRYAQQWHIRAGRLKVPVSGVMRRALAVYMRHLNHPDTDHKEEFRDMQRACNAPPVDDTDQQQVLARLQTALDGGNPLPHFRDILDGPESRARIAAINANVEALVNQMMGERAQRARDGKTRKALERLQAQQGGSL